MPPSVLSDVNHLLRMRTVDPRESRDRFGAHDPVVGGAAPVACDPELMAAEIAEDLAEIDTKVDTREPGERLFERISAVMIGGAVLVGFCPVVMFVAALMAAYYVATITRLRDEALRRDWLFGAGVSTATLVASVATLPLFRAFLAKFGYYMNAESISTLGVLMTIWSHLSLAVVGGVALFILGVLARRVFGGKRRAGRPLWSPIAGALGVLALNVLVLLTLFAAFVATSSPNYVRQFLDSLVHLPPQ
ncbi:MAG: hypothetical protein GC159_05400 [Phycisphaera sp.]|nr:hypothetical protein [Phycisphaera sp.]